MLVISLNLGSLLIFQANYKSQGFIEMQRSMKICLVVIEMKIQDYLNQC